MSASKRPQPESAFARRLRTAWSRLQPFPRPRYHAPTPKIGADQPLDVHQPPTARTLGAAAMSKEALEHVVEVVGRLTDADDYEALRVYYSYGNVKYGSYWRYADILTMLWGAVTLLKPQAYLEVGVWKGRSAAVVGATAPGCAVYGFDLWMPEYHGGPNPGPEFVRQELRKAGHMGTVELVSGDSRVTLPAFLRAHPALYFDLITIDGGKAINVWAADLANTLPRLKVGGVVVCDDLPNKPVLRRVWNRVILGDVRYVSWDFDDAGFGVAAAVRVSE